MMIFIYGLLGFVFLVFIHELGHFLAARFFGMTVTEFAIGMGPTLLQKTYKGTAYKICLIPLGGYCAIKGQEDFGNTDRNSDKDSFFGKSAFARFMVVFAGPLFSFLLGYILISTVIATKGETRLHYTVIDPPYTSQYFKTGDKIKAINGSTVEYWDEIQLALLKNIGKPNSIEIERNGKNMIIENYLFNPSEKEIPYSDLFSYYKEGPVIIAGVVKDSPAEHIGLKSGDIIIKANGKTIRSDKDLNSIVNSQAQIIKLIVHRYNNIQELVQKDTQFYNNKIYPYDVFEMNITPIMKDEKKVMGVNLFVVEGPEIEKLWAHTNISFVSALARGWGKSIDMLSINAKAIGQLLQGNKEIRDSLSGPVKIFYEVGRVSEAYGFMTFLSFIGTISLALAFFNLMPLPALDGGHMLIAVIEAVIRRPIKAKILNVIQITGIVLLMSIFVLVTIRDISNFF